MNKKKIIISTTVLIIFLCLQNFLYAAETDDVELKNLYQKYTEIRFKLKNIDTSFESASEIPLLMDYTVEIIKRNPKIAYYVSMTFSIRPHAINEVYDKYQKLKEKYLYKLDDPDTEPAEKFFFMLITLLYPCEFEYDNSISVNPKCNLCIEGLKKMKEYSANKDYAALATILLSNEKGYESCVDEFFKKFPDHPAVPTLKLNIISDYISSKEYDKCIEKTEELLKQHGNEKYPYGWTFAVSCYEVLCLCYIKKGDITTAKKYFDLIKQNAPLDPQLHQLKEYFINTD